MLFPSILPLLLSLSPLLPPTHASPTDFRGSGHLLAQNMSFNGYTFGSSQPSGCITDAFTWTLRSTLCGLFTAARTGLKYSDQFGNSTYVVLKSRHGVCGLGRKDRVVCGRWGGVGVGPWGELGDGEGGEREGAPEVLREGRWFAHDSNPVQSKSNPLNWEPVSFGKMWFTNFTPTAEKDSSIWNNVDETEPEEGVLLDPYTYGVSMYWDSVKI